MNRAVGIAILTIFAVGCDKPSSVASVPYSSVEPGAAPLSEQKMCAEQAEKSFTNSGLSEEKDGGGNTYTDHYDEAARVCYIETTTRHFTNNKFQYGHVIYDAFEGRVYGSFVSTSNKPEDLLECYVIPRGQSKMLCQSTDEFDNFALKYFGTTPD